MAEAKHICVLKRVRNKSSIDTRNWNINKKKDGNNKATLVSRKRDNHELKKIHFVLKKVRGRSQTHLCVKKGS